MSVWQWFEILASSLGGGFAAGILGGLLGLGGGIVIVPIMNYVLPLATIPRASLMHASVVSSLSFMTINSLNSTLQHWRAGHLNLRMFLRLGIPVTVGSCLGAALADISSDRVLRILFSIYIIYNVVMATLMLARHQTPPEDDIETGSLPREPVTSFLFTGAGTLCSLLGVGVAALLTPFFAARGYRFSTIAANNAALSSIVAVIGTTVSFAGTAAYIVAGLNEPGMPAYSFGYLYLPSFFALTVGALLGAPLGVRLSKKCSALTLKWLMLFVVLAAFLSMIAKMLH